MVIYPLSTVLHETRVKMGLLLTDYVVGEYYSFRSRSGAFKEARSVTAEQLGISNSDVKKAQDKLLEEGFLEIKGSELFLNDTWDYSVRLAQCGQHVTPKSRDLAKVFLTTLRDKLEENKISGALVPNPDNKAVLKSAQLKIDALLRQMNVREMDLKIVAVWAVKDWGVNPKQVKYIRAETLLRSRTKFTEYLSLANTYFQNKTT